MQRTERLAGQDGGLCGLGGGQSGVCDGNDRVHLGINRGSAIEMGLNNLDGRDLTLADQLGQASGVGPDDVDWYLIYLSTSR